MVRSHPHTYEYEPSDLPGALFRFLLAPVTTPWTMYLGAYDVAHGTSRLDRQEAMTHTAAWSSAALISWGYHSLMFPGQYSFVSGGAAVRSVGFLAASVPLAAVVLATAAAAGYVATADVHGGAIAMGNPSYGPGIYGSDPMGEFQEGVAGFWAMLGF